MFEFTGKNFTFTAKDLNPGDPSWLDFFQSASLFEVIEIIYEIVVVDGNGISCRNGLFM